MGTDYQYACKALGALQRMQATARLPVEGARSRALGKIVWSVAILGALLLFTLVSGGRW